MPAVTYAEISCPRVHTMGKDPGLKYPRFQFTAWATTYAGAKAVAEQIRLAIQDYTTTTGTTIQASILDNELDTYDPDTGHYGIPVDFIIWAAE